MVRWLCAGSELNPSGHPDWTLRIPVVRPWLASGFLRGLAGVAGACAAGVLAAAWGAAPNLAAVWISATAAGILGLAAGPWPGRGLGRLLEGGNVSALAISPAGAVALRVDGRWQEVELIRVTRGWRCLRLRARPACMHDPLGVARGGGLVRIARQLGGRPGCRSFTVWQEALGGPAWRRTCVLATRRVRRPARVWAAGSPLPRRANAAQLPSTPPKIRHSGAARP